MKPEIPVFFATDDNYAPFLSVTLKSMLANASKKYFYKIHVLTTNLDQKHIARLSKMMTENSSIEFVSLKNELDKLGTKLHLRDYYSQETYYRFFIANTFPQYDKVLYLDADLAVVGDISELYNQELGNNLVAAIQEEVMATVKVFGDYVEQVLDIPCADYFNAGIILINAKAFREECIESQFIDLLKRFKFRVTQDEDYLNVLCKGRVKMLQLGWNKTSFKNIGFNDKDLKIVHYKINWKPWLYDDVEYQEHFWKYAKKTEYFEDILAIKAAYTDEQKQRDALAYERLVQMAIEDSNDPENYKNTMLKERKITA